MDAEKFLNGRYEKASAGISKIRKALESDSEFSAPSGLCIYITGSYGRKEAHQDSDLDLFFVHNGTRKKDSISYIEKTLMNASIIKSCQKLGFPEFTKGGIYLEVHYLDDILDHLGSPKDDYRNYFTARMLLILESIPIYSKDLYDNAISKIISTYYRDYHDHEKDFTPVFLVNDIHRYWRTMCLNYEHIRNRKTDMDGVEKNKAHLKNLKLKFSRLLTCYSMISAILSVSDSVTPDDIKRLIYMTPMERVLDISARNPALIDTIAEIRGYYAWFMEKTGRSQGEVMDWISDRSERDNAFDRGRHFSKLIYKLVTESPADPDKLRYLIV